MLRRCVILDTSGGATCTRSRRIGGDERAGRDNDGRDDGTGPPADFARLRADATGVIHPPAGPDARIASLVPSLTELLVDLGLGDRIVARTRFCIHPAEAVAAIPAVGGTKKVHLERLRALAPTHAILNIDENTAAMAEALEAFVPQLIVTHPLIPDDNRDLFALFGQVFDRKDKAQKLYTAYNREKAAI